jgi:hypothetical protein
LKTCKSCLEKQSAIRTGQQEKENVNPQDNLKDKPKAPKARPVTLSWETFLSLLKDNLGRPFEVDAFVELICDPLVVQSASDQATTISKAIWEAMGYRFK